MKDCLAKREPVPVTALELAQRDERLEHERAEAGAAELLAARSCGEVTATPRCIDCGDHCSFGGCPVADREPDSERGVL